MAWVCLEEAITAWKLLARRKICRARWQCAAFGPAFSFAVLDVAVLEEASTAGPTTEPSASLPSCPSNSGEVGINGESFGEEIAES